MLRSVLTAVVLSAVSPTAVAAQEVRYLTLERVAPGASVCAGGLCQPEGLAQVFGRLALTEAGGPVPTVRIYQLGDSHTAGGRITGAVRARLQGRFGYAVAADALSPTQAEPGPGVLLSEYGQVGATLRDLQAWREAGAAGGLTPWAADLVILAFGTNEGFEDGLDGAAYEAALRDEIARLRALTPGAAILILGAPDALRSRVGGGCSADGLRAPPPALAVVRDVQRRVAAGMGVAFWDWHGRMGGDCSTDRLALMADPYVRGDRVHFTGAGADWVGGMLAGDLLAAYDAWKAGPKSEARSAD